MDLFNEYNVSSYKFTRSLIDNIMYVLAKDNSLVALDLKPVKKYGYMSNEYKGLKGELITG